MLDDYKMRVKLITLLLFALFSICFAGVLDGCEYRVCALLFLPTELAFTFQPLKVLLVPVLPSSNFHLHPAAKLLLMLFRISTEADHNTIQRDNKIAQLQYPESADHLISMLFKTSNFQSAFFND